MSAQNGGQQPPPTPITLHVPIGAQVGVDGQNRVCIFQAISEGGIGVYQVLIPIATLKGLTGELIAREGRNEAEKLKAGAKIAVPKSRIIKPR